MYTHEIFSIDVFKVIKYLNLYIFNYTIIFFCSVIHIFTIGFIVIMTMNCFTGLIMYAYFYECDPVQLKVSIYTAEL